MVEKIIQKNHLKMKKRGKKIKVMEMVEVGNWMKKSAKNY